MKGKTLTIIEFANGNVPDIRAENWIPSRELSAPTCPKDKQRVDALVL
ncbi:hypothetical protein ACFSR7_35920 [Cohnella sp. GCM10020058]